MATISEAVALQTLYDKAVSGSDTVVEETAQVATTVTSGKFFVSALNTAPANAGATGTLGEIRIADTAIYVCTATNTWKKVAIATW